MLYTNHKPLTGYFQTKQEHSATGCSTATTLGNTIGRLRLCTTLYLSPYRAMLMLKVCHSYSSLAVSKISKLPDPRLFNMQQIETLPVTSAQVKTATNRNTILSKVLLYQTWVANYDTRCPQAILELPRRIIS